eukprot:TRINITY_DN13341_c0_g1_i1.p1 TRINITY_DN13341_c0_g1~~TRINITY_DN13341_c0_g1_i1.p1  ORF type:complete len:182 (+),score=42.14 TRINITY_DN13341_c0_g1_i1:405-950(+)
MEGFQLWINLPKHQKMIPPTYQDVPKDKIPIFQGDGYEVKVIAGTFQDKSSHTQTIVPIHYLDVHLHSQGVHWKHRVPSSYNCFAYVYRGSARFGEVETANTEQIVLFGEGNLIEAWSLGTDVRFLVLCGEPIRDPIAQYGPFVMNTQEELQTAIREYHSNSFIKHSATFSSKTSAIEDCQ